jgi:hypothetical protein
MGRLKAQHVLAKLGFMQPLRYEPAQSSLTFGRMIMGVAMKRVPGKGRSALAGDNQNEAVAAGTGRIEKARQPQACIAHAKSVQVELRIILDLASQEALSRAPVETGEERRLDGFSANLRRHGCLRR